MEWHPILAYRVLRHWGRGVCDVRPWSSGELTGAWMLASGIVDLILATIILAGFPGTPAVGLLPGGWSAGTASVEW